MTRSSWWSISLFMFLTCVLAPGAMAKSNDEEKPGRFNDRVIAARQEIAESRLRLMALTAALRDSPRQFQGDEFIALGTAATRAAVESAAERHAHAQGLRLGYLLREQSFLQYLESRGHTDGTYPQVLEETLEELRLAIEHWFESRDFLSHAHAGHPDAVRIARIQRHGWRRALLQLTAWGLPAAVVASAVSSLVAGEFEPMSALSGLLGAALINAWLRIAGGSLQVFDRAPSRIQSHARALRHAFLAGVDDAFLPEFPGGINEAFELNPPLTGKTLTRFLTKLDGNLARRCAAELSPAEDG